MRARKGSHRHVYTERGSGASKDELVDSLIVPEPDASDQTVYVCEHGGFWPTSAEYPQCGICLVGADGTPEETYEHFLKQLRNVAKHTVGYLRKYDSLYGYDVDDAISECLMLLVLNPGNLKAIVEAKNPMAMAYQVARRRLMTALSRNPYLKKVSLQDDPADDGLTAEEKLEALDLERNGYDDPYAFKIAHFEILATKENVRRLFQEMENGFALLQKQTQPIGAPFNVSIVIKLRHGFYGDKPYTWLQLVKWVNGNTSRKQTRDQVRHAVEKGEAFVKDHIVKTIFGGGGRLQSPDKPFDFNRQENSFPIFSQRRDYIVSG